MLKFTCIGSFKRSRANFEGTLHNKNILQSECVLLVQTDTTHRRRRIKLYLKREIWPLHLDMLPCNPKMGVHFSHLILWGHFFFPLFLTGIGTYCLLPSHNIRIFLLCVKFYLLAMLVVLVMRRSVSFSWNLHYMSFLELDMANDVAFPVFYYWIGAGFLLRIWALICLHIILYSPISFLYHIISFPTNLLLFFHNNF